MSAMIRRLRVKGFQSLEDLDISLGGFTVVVGPSNSGKSALRRALLGMVTNAPATGRLRAGSKTMSVEVETDDAVVRWEKGKGRNAYVVGDLEQTKPGSTITPEAAQALGLDDINFAGQFDPPFLLTESPSQVARSLGELTNINVLFEGIREANRLRKNASGKANTLGEELERARAEMESFSDLASEQEALNIISEALHLADTEARRASSLMSDLAQARYEEGRLDQANAFLASVPDPATAEQVLAQATARGKEAQDLNNQVGSLQAAQRRLESAEAALGSLPVPPAPEVVDRAEGAAQAAQRLSVTWAEALRYAESIVQAEDALASWDRHLLEAQSSLDAIEACPLCGAPLQEGDLCVS